MGAMSSGHQEETNQIKQKVIDLKADFKFGQARKMLQTAIETHPDNVWFKQQLALCTYKDEELMPQKRFEKALAVLEEIGLRDETNKDSETLALGGAIYKRWWEFGGQLENLYEALIFYRAAWERNPDQDRGYGGINATYILQILASRSRSAANRSKTQPVEAEKFESQADDIRQAIIDQLKELMEKEPALEKANWLVVTLAEAYFGKRDYPAAKKWLAQSKQLEVSEWERQTTFRQLVSIGRLQGIELPGENVSQSEWHAAWQALAELLGEDTETALSCYRGKVGLALSGGGFRASLFHLGVLARLAEMDVLRSVEALSTVSGGSIVGAHYYLEVKHLLETKADKEITREDYIELIQRLQNDFLNGVQENIRTLAFADFRKNLDMIFTKTYSRSHRLGELYEEKLFGKVQDNHPAGQPRNMQDLLIQPLGETDFNPTFSNWRRRAKIPILLLNATSLNSGHNWRFTARSMGEPPGLMGSQVDKNSRYRRLWYDQAPKPEHKTYPIGYAVAASACVPGLFEPLPLEELYPDKVVRLVDGGVHDNQGVQGLLDEGCTLILCSDASGQMDDRSKPSDSIPSVLLRSNSILMDRVREAEYQDLEARLNSRALQGLFFIHLKKDLPVRPQDWIDCQDPTPEIQTGKTPYGIDSTVQNLLAGIRTDLDSFTDVEAYALMCSGYLMTEQQFTALQEIHEKYAEPGKWGDFQVDASRETWTFLDLEGIMGPQANPAPARKDLELQLSVAASQPFKIWKLEKRLQKLGWGMIAAAGILVAIYILLNWSKPLISPSITLGSTIIALILVAAVTLIPALKWFQSKKALQGIAKNALIALVGSIVAKIHLKQFDAMFLERGKLKRLLGLAKK